MTETTVAEDFKEWSCADKLTAELPPLKYTRVKDCLELDGRTPKRIQI